MRVNVALIPRVLALFSLRFGPLDVVVEHLHRLQPPVVVSQAMVVSSLAVCCLQDANRVFLL